jgi:glycosyltransferase involved in cell wall biosynthesis
LKILQINASYKPAYLYGGPTMSVSKLSEELVAAGYHTEVYTTTANGPDELPVTLNKPVVVDGVTVTYFNRITKDHSHFSPGLLKAVWKNVKKFDIIHISAWWNTVSVLSCCLAILRGVPVIISPRGMLSNYSFNNRNSLFKTLIHTLLGKKLLTKCGIHVTSQYEEVAIRAIIKPSFIADIPNFIELGKINTKDDKDVNGDLKLLFLSRIEEKKGLDILLNALANVKTPFHLTITGSGDEIYINKLKQITQQHNLTENITWAGFQKQNKFNLLQQHHLLVLPSHDENFGNVVIESLSVGTAVLISNKVGLADYVQDNKLGWVCNASADNFSNQIDCINELRDELKTISKLSPTIIYRDFNEDLLVKRYIQMYQQYINYHSSK